MTEYNNLDQVAGHRQTFGNTEVTDTQPATPSKAAQKSHVDEEMKFADKQVKVPSSDDYPSH